VATAEPWSLTSLREKLIKIGAKVVSHGRYTVVYLAGDRGFESLLLQRGVRCEPDFRGGSPSMTVGDFANANPAPHL
jgi:hypothetical protein